MRTLAGAITGLRRLVDLTLIALIGVVLFALFLGKIVPLTGHQTIIIGGSSMEPGIDLGAAVVIGPVRARELARGDVVSLQIGPSRTTFTHRIVDVISRPDGIWIRTKGDANAEPDPTLVPASAILGRVQWSIPWVGFLLALLSLPIGVLFVLGLAVTLLAIAWLLESLEGDDESVAPVAADARHGEPIPTRPVGHRSVFPTNAAAPASGLASTSAVASIAILARPTVRQHFLRSRDHRARRDRWLADRRHQRPGTN